MQNPHHAPSQILNDMPPSWRRRLWRRRLRRTLIMLGLVVLTGAGFGAGFAAGRLTAPAPVTQAAAPKPKSTDIVVPHTPSADVMRKPNSLASPWPHPPIP